MRKLDREVEEYLLKRRIKLARNKKKRRDKKKQKISGEVEKAASFRRASLKAPQDLNLSNNFEESISFFSQIRDISNQRTVNGFNIDFKPIKTISAAAALIFTAELDRIKRIRGNGKGLRVMDFNKWNHDIKILLRDMGMYKLLRIKNINKAFNNLPSGNLAEKFLEFQTGNQVDPDDALRLGEIIGSVVGTIPMSKQLQIGLTEAMANSSEHAYPIEYIAQDSFGQKQWWMSASFNDLTKRLSIIFYDQGIGIPESLPKKFSEILKMLGLLQLNNDAEMIKAAITIGRSSTEKSYRGKGLKDVKNYIDNQIIENGYLRIYSGKGEYCYEKDASGSRETIKNSSQKLQGTLIEWQVCIKNYEQKSN